MEEGFAARFASLLESLDGAVQSADQATARVRYVELTNFVRSLGPAERQGLERRRDVLGWTVHRRQRLKSRWACLEVHGGSWDGWQAKMASGGTSGRQVLLDAARDLVYWRPPSPEQRRTLWRFCVDLNPAGLAGSDRLLPLDRAGANPEPNELEQMRLDADRTPKLTGDQQEALVRILHAYCCGTDDVLPAALRIQYVQGMHMLVACPLWAGLCEREAIKVFEVTLGSLCAGYYSDLQFSHFQRDVRVIEVLLRERMPQLLSALNGVGCPVQLLAFDPLLCLFTHHAPGDVAIRLWDVLLLEGDVAIFAVLLALWHHLLPEVFASESFDPSGGGDLPFAETIRERSAVLSAAELETVLRRVRAMLEEEGEERFGGRSTPLRQRVEELRREGPGVLGGVGDADQLDLRTWWDQFRAELRSLMR